MCVNYVPSTRCHTVFVLRYIGGEGDSFSLVLISCITCHAVSQKTVTVEFLIILTSVRKMIE